MEFTLCRCWKWLLVWQKLVGRSSWDQLKPVTTYKNGCTTKTLFQKKLFRRELQKKCCLKITLQSCVHVKLNLSIAANGSVHAGCTQHQRVCTQICSRVLCELGLRISKVKFKALFTPGALHSPTRLFALRRRGLRHNIMMQGLTTGRFLRCRRKQLCWWMQRTRCVQTLIRQNRKLCPWFSGT